MIKKSKKIRPKRKRLPSISSLEKKADAVFSQYIRLREADEGGTVQCVTCQKLMHWKESQCGHFIKRASRGVRFDERNCNVQCHRCNFYLGGNDGVYAVYIIDHYGRETYDELISWKSKEFKRYRSDYEELIETYKRKLSELN
jgi:hypothetical protein